MSRENVESVQRSLAHFMATGEPDWAVLDEDVEVHDHDTPDQGNYRGPEGFAKRDGHHHARRQVNTG